MISQELNVHTRLRLYFLMIRVRGRRIARRRLYRPISLLDTPLGGGEKTRWRRYLIIVGGKRRTETWKSALQDVGCVTSR